MKKLLVVLVAVVLLVVSAVVAKSAFASEAPAPVSHAAVVPAPTSAAGFTKMFQQVDPAIWGAADVSISVPMADGRVVWLYGDTFSDNYGMVNSSAIVQTGGSLHVSQDGMQLLPAGGVDAKGHKIVYWIEAAEAIGANTLRVTVAPTWIGKDNSLSFGRAAALDKVAVVTLDDNNDVTFEKWDGEVAQPKMDQKFLTVADGAPYQKEGHLFYNRLSHPEARLSSGKVLVTICQNRVHEATLASGRMDYSQYRPIFMEK